MITVKIPSAYLNLIGSERIELESSVDIDDLLGKLSVRFPKLSKQLLDEEGNPGLELLITVNGISISDLQGTKTPLKENDEIEMYLLLAGG
jgi:sulfur-carrier protein